MTVQSKSISCNGNTLNRFCCLTMCLQVQCLKSLLSAGCDVNVTDHSGDSAKRIAELYSQTECLLAIGDHAGKELAKINESVEDEQSSSAK